MTTGGRPTNRRTVPAPGVTVRIIAQFAAFDKAGKVLSSLCNRGFLAWVPPWCKPARSALDRSAVASVASRPARVGAPRRSEALQGSGSGPPQVGHATLAITGEDVDGPELETGVPVRRFPLRRSCESGLGTLLIIAAHGDRAGDEIRARRQRVEVTCRRKVRCGGLRITRPAIRGTVDVPGCSPRQRQRRNCGDSSDHRRRNERDAHRTPGPIRARRSGQSLSRGQ